jgi:NAD-dependent dihydropyrimidine dehydrogenase PreA subunit
MINITDKSKCCGCAACVNACPVQCIVMRRDRDEGFDYPVANPDICIGCGKCESVCPVLAPAEPSTPLAAYAVRFEEFVDGSSSGGVFPALAKAVIDEGGVVFGAVMEPDLTVGHTEAETMDEVQRMRGSKYVQSDLYSVFFDVKEYIKSGRKVLFTGTPCQVAGLHKYLGGKSDRLVTVDIACHGVPGPGLWEMYVKALGKRAGSEITAADFRDKSKGWRRYGFKTVSTSGTSTSVRASEDPYMALFMQDMTLRPSCYNCPAKGGRSCSDLTVADLWSVARTAPQINDDRGASGVLVNTHAGIELLEKTKPEYRLELSPNEVMSDNGGFAPSVQIPERRVEFFEGLKVAGVDVYRHMSRYVKRKPLPQRLMRSLRSTLSSIRRRIVK